VSLVRDRFDHDAQHRVLATEEADEPTRVPGLYLAGPALPHQPTVGCCHRLPQH